jgi:cell wall-associated NlpC family hydrolase
MSNHIRFALLFLVVLGCVCARAGTAAAGAIIRPPIATRFDDPLGAAMKNRGRLQAKVRARVKSQVAAHAHVKVSHATAVAHQEEKIVRFARQLMGIRYVYGGTSPRTGFDCSGFTRFVYAHFGIVLPHYSVSQFNLGRRVSRAGLRPGDLVFFDGLGHVGLYVGSGRFIHAPHTGTDVQISALSGWYGAEYDGARRIV